MKTALYSIVPEQTIKAIADTFYECIHLPIQLINEQGEILISLGETPAFCRSFQRHLPASETCEKLHVSASKRAVTLGEPYIFACHADLNHIVFPLISRQTFLGSILVGPFLMDEPDSILISDVSRRYRIPMDDALDLYDEAGDLPVIEPARVNHISHLLFYLFSNLITESKAELQRNNRKLLQQSRISESIQRYKDGSIQADSYPYEKEKELLAKVKLGDIREANAVLNDLLGYVLFSQGNSLEIIKARHRALFAPVKDRH